MLAGEAQFNQMTRAALFHAIVNEAPRLPSEQVEGIPALFDTLIAKALAREVAIRFPTAGAMKEMLDGYRIPRDDVDAGPHSTVAFLLRRLRRAPGFSALTHRIEDVLKLTSEANGDSRSLANLLAKDVTLTQRVLTMANSAMYGAGEVPNLSRAIIVMGLSQVRHCVMNCLLQSQFASGTPELHTAMVAAFFSGVLSQNLVKQASLPRAEDAFICACSIPLGKCSLCIIFPKNMRKSLLAATTETARLPPAESYSDCRISKLDARWARNGNCRRKFLMQWCRYHGGRYPGPSTLTQP